MSASSEQECPVCDGDAPLRDRLKLAARHGTRTFGHVHRVVVPFDDLLCDAVLPWLDEKGKQVETTSTCDLPRDHDGPHRSTVDVTWEEA